MAFTSLTGDREWPDTQSLNFMINHVFLSPQLPQEDDTDAQHLLALVQALCGSVSGFLSAESSSSPSVRPALEMLERLLKTDPGLGLYETDKTSVLRGIIAHLKNGDVALFHLRDQNAGLLLTAQQDDILFEAFELLAPNHNVMSCKGALLREFPNRAATITIDKLKDDDFLDELVHVIQKLEVGIAPMARPKVTKAGTVQPEERDTLSPTLATGMLIDVLVGLGQGIVPQRITKRSREQVGWDNVLLPFHRSPTWLLLRVALRLVLDRQAVLVGKESWYKPLMAYHHARILSIAVRATQPSIPNDKLFSMNAKLARRIIKLDPIHNTRWLEDVRKSVSQSRAILEERWEKVQDGDAKVLPLNELPELSFHHDCELKVRNLGQHLSWIKSRSTGHRDPMGPGDLTHFDSLPHSELPALSSYAPDDAAMDCSELLAFEAWVESALPKWSNDQPEPNAAVNSLQSLIDAYHKRARAAYEGVPDALSVMYLVIMELWVAMDKIAGNAIPLLLDYDPGFPPDVFHPLLLERKEEMGRLKQLEDYLSRRQNRAPSPYPSAFGGFGRKESFAVRFYPTSSEHQRLRKEIESWGSTMEEEKLQEYREMKAKHESLARNISERECEYYWDNRRRGRYHSFRCTRCPLVEQMDLLKIDVFEWPLPDDSNDANAVVVEISLPLVVKIWRNVTWKLVTEVFREKKDGHCVSSRESLYFAGRHSGLRQFLKANSRLQPASTVKPMEVSHYKRKHILEATPGNICVPHAAQYEYYDEPSELLAEEEIPGACIPRHCSYAELAKGLPVEDWIRSAQHTSNEVIAGQFRCPLDTTLEEFRAFGNLRSGVTLQWANILCQLVIPSVDLNKKPTFALILQASLEAGPDAGVFGGADSILRRAHIDTQDEPFMSRILQAMVEALERVRESWQNDIALCLLVCLSTRLLSLSPSAETSNTLLKNLAQLRRVSIAWARVLLDKLNHSDVDRERQEWTQRLLMAALICAATFNMGENHLASVLDDPQDLAFFVESAVLARNHLPASGRPSDPIALQLAHRWHAVMYQARDLVMEEVMDRGNPGLDNSIKQFWADYSPPSAEWMQRDVATQSHILECSNSHLSVTFNLLTGNLFVNGYPLSKLPLAYQSHETFSQLFGEQILDVGPSSDPEMQFSACRDQNEWVVHFAMMDHQLVVRAVRQRPQEIWEYIPRSHLRRDLPNSFVNNYAHWLNLSTNEVEFRPIAQKWVTSSTSWRLASVSGRVMLKKGSSFVIDPSSHTAKLSHQILSSIESSQNIDLIFDCDANSLVLELPRLSISFWAREGETIIKSRNYTGMQIDRNQGIGSLIGLSDKLVLKPEGGPGLRMILVPRGQVSAHHINESNHVKVSILRPNDKHVRHDSFLVDDKLGCLTDTGSLQSKLYLCWLHALTSHCLPDPLTLRTGTEEALRILDGAAVKSYPTLDHDAREFLGQIANLSPRREYYPRHLRVMEQTTWNYDIPPLSQHDDFWPFAKSIYEHYETFGKLFQLGGGEEHTTTDAAKVFLGSEEKRSFGLEERARIRNAIFCASEFGAERHTTAEDKWYRSNSRKTTGFAENRAKVAQLARCVDTGGGRLLFRPSSYLPETIVSTNGSQFDGLSKADLEFDLEYLAPPSKSLEGRWCGLHRALVTERNTYRRIFFLSSLLYAEGSDKNIVQVLMALGSISVFSQAGMLPPSEPVFDLTVNRDTLSGILTKIVEDGAKDLEECPESRLTRHEGESLGTFKRRQDREWGSNSANMISEFVAALQTQIRSSWVVNAPPGQASRSYLNVDEIMPGVRTHVEMARRSEAFHLYLASVSRELNLIDIEENCNLAVPSTSSEIRPSSRPGFISAMSLFSQPAPCLNRPQPKELFQMLFVEPRGLEQKHMHLSTLVDELSGVGSLQEHQVSYLDELRRSMNSPDVPRRLMAVPKDDPAIQPTLVQHLQAVREEYDAIRHHLKLALTGTSIAHQICDNAGFYPRTSSIFFLQRLTRTFWAQLSKPWRHCLVNLALNLICLQRAERLASHGLNLPERWIDLQRELSNPGDHDNPDWNPLEYPESLLLEIEQGIMIRPVQNKIAAVMRSPPAMENSVMQLNMGEGKSSVIAPIVAAALADGSRLVRVVVAKPQSSQMTHMLISRLAGLINRRIFYLPFSRSIQLSEHDVWDVRKMIDTCQSEGGVLLVQPEHLLSFKLMGIDKSWVGENKTKSTLGTEIIRLHQDFESAARDIVDESDENFSVKFELIYTMGTQEAVEMSPNRWVLIQGLLEMTETVVRKLVAPNGPVTGGVSEGLLFKDHGAGRVPVIRVLGESAGRQLIKRLADEVCRLGLRGFPIHNQTAQIRRAVLNYILLENVTEDDIAMVENTNTGLFCNPPTKNAILLLRGLLSKGVILFALGQKRFRVNYGLAPDRQPPTGLAVPYRAKDMPSPRSEFSHPDVVIVLTCLSYYYRGLSDAELYTCLELLSKSDQTDEEYGRWVTASPLLPASFHHFSSINLKDRSQCEGDVFRFLRYARPAVDFYLTRLVFPREMKQFPLKLSASGWDLAKPKKQQPLTGFSGTNDSKGVLPLSVTALDLQPQTNAAVLSTLLREENTVLELGDRGDSQLGALTEDMLLGGLVKSEPAMRVILDVGAQIIESSNLQMARRLLDSVPTSGADAVIFFNDQDELSVLLRNGMVDSFLTSPFATHTDRCLVFLDQAHTRGTDLKLPDDYRAAVTLGPGVTKDTLVQACMRMRKLGQGQSVSFIVSPEMQKRIRSIRNITDGRPLAVPDVLAWAISEAWDEAVRAVPLWATQGVRHLRQETIWQQADESGAFSSAHVQEYLEPEAMSLEQRYRPMSTTATPPQTEIATRMADLSLENTQPNPNETSPERNPQLAAIQEKLLAFAPSTGPSSSTLQEEQERELAPEIEEERHLSRPPAREALPHSLHDDLVQFTRTGHIPSRGSSRTSFLNPYAALSQTGAASLFSPGLASFPSDLLITADFARTVDETGPMYCADSYQRGVQWVLLTSSSSARRSANENHRELDLRRRIMVVVSQWEADQLKAVIGQFRRDVVGSGQQPRRIPPVTLHAYLPRPSLTFQSMEDLKTYTIPTAVMAAADWEEAPPMELVMQLNLFAGQLYLRSYDEYVRLCRYLGLVYTENRGDEVVAQDGFVGKKRYPECQFDASPLAFLAEVYKKIRRDCVGIEKTHMGKILAGEILTERDFQGGV
ncbi:hypothetical protein C8A00DRAFT_33763 [Chaetomidium leptoderma]|uniref:ubiquitinyl hydrolase 1 n=1 Tax=Chaetomidium leptoderma TaxID=669021 RepID=A0AAN6ZX22_9PEZI|nr:hypothetical protein C8A00DRAFT_33763 [Chaetomidium leptoderma]